MKNQKLNDKTLRHISWLSAARYTSPWKHALVSACQTRALGFYVADLMRYQLVSMKWVQCHLKETRNFTVCLQPDGGSQFQAYVAANWGGEQNTKRHSRTGCIICYGDMLIYKYLYMTSALQKFVTLSSTESKYIAVSHGRQIIVWLCTLRSKLGEN